MIAAALRLFVTAVFTVEAFAPGNGIANLAGENGFAPVAGQIVQLLGGLPALAGGIASVGSRASRVPRSAR